MKLRWLLLLAVVPGGCLRSPSISTHGSGGVEPAASDAAAGTCGATCSTPAGLVQYFESNDEIWDALVGSWRICGSLRTFAGPPADTIGVEFTAPYEVDDAGVKTGRLYFLTQGPSGPVRGAGFDYQEIFEVMYGQLYCHPTPSSGYNLDVAYSPCPREWAVYNGEGEGDAVLVSF